MALNNPTVGSRGLWELKTPYQSYLPVNTTLECTAITNYGQLFSMGIDPYQTYYQKYNISKEDYKKHSDEGGRIIFLRTDSGQIYSFPLHYLISYPIGTGVNYCSIGIGLRLGALPLNTNVEAYIQKVEELADSMLGVNVQAETMALSEIMIVDNASHVRLEKVRKQRTKDHRATLDQLDEANRAKKVLSDKLGLVERKTIELSNRILDLEALLRKNNINFETQ